ncbi:hypothetical protein DIDNDMLP_00319 [Klebsiella phage KP13-7]|uniref:Uncharacterized protein n=1 Tax=Klebsiella phage vB_KleM_RaK2 TaxID=1147094 RepID=H6X4L7_9CAUD|nr:hypothetical protein F403_gp125 [Klebsiella phage vB_KleM_RaK2]YP_010843421.1 hypothetical protein ACQ27_gp537 [Klebsiella phage K64-1]AFA44683.1 hypothetical protein RaK2_00410 [Klebsiella phage vB_KleM_RaK2]UYL05304.1 hypothetical protein DIDNDMLP_00319 [Klebsiella phage KP13-7]
MKYTVIGILGSDICSTNTSLEAVQVVLKQIPLSEKNAKKFENRLQNAKEGSTIYIEYGGASCAVKVHKN